MKLGIGLDLSLGPGESARLLRLQEVFAAACNCIAPVAREHRCWNRVALHHLTYRTLRENFPQLGSQMACNAVFAVARGCRLVYQGPASPFNVKRLGAAPLPLLRFMPKAPVYFDRHTFALKDDVVSLFTLEGRLRCPVRVTPQQARHLQHGRIEEIALYHRDGRHTLDFRVETDAASAADARSRKMPTELPDHVQVDALAVSQQPARPEPSAPTPP